MSGSSKLALTLGGLSALIALGAWSVVVLGKGDPESRGYTRQFMSFFIPMSTLILGGLAALVSARTWYRMGGHGESLAAPVAALVLSAAGIVLSLLL
jgi:hypothetical protein